MNKNINKRVFVSLAVAAMLASVNVVNAAERKVVSDGETANIKNQTFENLNYKGAGAAVENRGISTFESANFTGNSATESAGAIYSQGGTLTIDKSTFTNNSALNGGAIFSSGDDTLTIKDSVFKNNSAKKVEIDTDDDLDSDTDIDSDSDVDADSDSDMDIDSDDDTDIDGDDDTDDEIGSDTDSDSEPDIDTGSGDSDDDTDIDGDDDTDDEIGGDTDSDSEPDIDTGSGDSDDDTDIDGDDDTDDEIGSDTDSDSEPDIDTGSGDSDDDTDIDGDNDTDADTDTDSDSTEDSDTDSDTDSDDEIGDTDDEDDDLIIDTDSDSDSDDSVNAISSKSSKRLLLASILDEEDDSEGRGGALFIDKSETTIDNTTFEGNSATRDGGAIYAVNGATLTINNSTFKSNTAGETGGAIAGASTAKFIINDSTFEGNTAKSRGGAISSKGITVVNNSTFKNNSAMDSTSFPSSETVNDKTLNSEMILTLGNGGAIASSGELEVKDSTFDSNKSVFGGAIYSDSEESLTVTNSKFTNNTALENVLTNNSSVDDKTGQYNLQGGNGGAIYTVGETLVEDSEFTNNTAGSGGAIFANRASIKNSIFKGNAAKGSESGTVYSFDESGNITVDTYDEKQILGSGGAISVYGDDETTIENSLFENNSSGISGGGAIYADVATLNISDTNFIGNKTTGNGGAIYSTGDLYINASQKDVTFSGNKASLDGNDIYLNQNKLYLDAANNRKITFSSGITGDKAEIKINSVNDNSVGTIVFDSQVSPKEGSTLAVNAQNGTLKLTDESYLKGTDLTLEENATLDLINGKIGNVTANSLKSNNGSVNIDMDLANNNKASDFFESNSVTGDINLKQVNLLSDLSDDLYGMSYTTDLENLNIKTPKDGINTITNKNIYTVTASGQTVNVERVVDASGNALKGDMFTVAVNQNDKVGDKEINLSDNRTFSMTDNVKITGNNTEKGWTGNLGGEELDIIGNGYTINGNGKSGITISDGQTLSIKDTNVSNFKGSEKGTFTVKEGGILNISALNKNVNVNTSDSDAIYLDGSESSESLAKAVLSTGDNKTLTISKNISSAKGSNELLLTGSGKISLKGAVDSVTITNENKNTEHSNYIDDVTYNLNSGTVKFAKDAYLNGKNSNNVLNFNGGTLNIANGAVGAINLGGLNINSPSNIMVDADLARAKMDTLHVNSNNVSAASNLNVSGINLLSDAKKTKTNVNFVDPTITLSDSEETLASHITTTVSEVAYSPVWKYGVEYDEKTGNFMFTRGAGSSPNNSKAYNPAVMVGPVAAQAGGYMAMLDTYANGFENMDLRMLSPLSARIAQKNANKYAISDSSDILYAKSEYNASGIYVKPYTSFDSVKMKHGPKVNNLAYGSFIGGDSSVHVFKNGAEGVFSPYIAYQGNHQNYQGNSVFQNGGTLGFTGTLYKGNFFTGLTAGIGMNVSDVNTMYGNEDFPMLMGGVANKTGYNIEFKEGKFIIQPSFLISYTVVDTFNHTNNAGVHVDSNALHAIQLSPNVKFILNTKNNWQPYATIGMMWNLIDETKFTANDIYLPELSIKPYVQYGLGVQKNIGERFTAYGQVTVRNGGRNGIGAFFGGRMMLGSDSRQHL